MDLPTQPTSPHRRTSTPNSPFLMEPCPGSSIRELSPKARHLLWEALYEAERAIAEYQSLVGELLYMLYPNEMAYPKQATDAPETESHPPTEFQTP